MIDIAHETDFLRRELRCHCQAVRVAADAVLAREEDPTDALGDLKIIETLLMRIDAALDEVRFARDRHRLLQARAAAGLAVSILQRVAGQHGVQVGTA